MTPTIPEMRGYGVPLTVTFVHDPDERWTAFEQITDTMGYGDSITAALLDLLPFLVEAYERGKRQIEVEDQFPGFEYFYLQNLMGAQ